MLVDVAVIRKQRDHLDDEEDNRARDVVLHRQELLVVLGAEHAPSKSEEDVHDGEDAVERDLGVLDGRELAVELVPERHDALVLGVNGCTMLEAEVALLVGDEGDGDDADAVVACLGHVAADRSAVERDLAPDLDALWVGRSRIDSAASSVILGVVHRVRASRPASNRYADRGATRRARARVAIRTGLIGVRHVGPGFFIRRRSGQVRVVVFRLFRIALRITGWKRCAGAPQTVRSTARVLAVALAVLRLHHRRIRRRIATSPSHSLGFGIKPQRSSVDRRVVQRLALGQGGEERAQLVRRTEASAHWGQLRSA